MFDLEYYNEITDFGKLYDKLSEECRSRGSVKYIDGYNRSKLKEKHAKICEHYMNGLILFENKHSSSYCTWYNNYYNKINIMDNISNKYKSAGIVRPVDKLHSGICKYKN